jgi:hypothetical protein
MKKIICFWFWLFLALVPILKAEAMTYTPMSGDLIKTAKSSGIYIVDDNLKRHLFPNEATFWTWYSGSWSSQKIKTILQEDFEELNIGKNVTARPGANLIMFDNGNKSYAVTPGGVLCETRALYGDNWQSRIIKIQSAFETDYVKDNSCVVISTSKLPDGSLISYAGSNDVYYIDNGKKRKVTTAGLSANSFKTASIIKDVAKTMTYDSGSGISVFDYNLGILNSFNYTQAAEVSSRPDFVVSDIVFPTSRIIVNQPVEIRMTIRNLGGNAVSDQGLRNIVFSGTDWVTQTVSHPDYPSATSPLMTGQSFEIIYSGKFVGSGGKDFTAKVDEPSEVLETSETNNTYSERITVYSE